MTDLDIYNCLCYYDTQSDEDKEYNTYKSKPNNCYCESCFRGQTPLAEYILELKGIDKNVFIKKMQSST